MRLSARTVLTIVLSFMLILAALAVAPGRAVSAISVSEQEPNGSTAEATRLEGSRSFSATGTLTAGSDDWDVYSFDISDPTTITVAATDINHAGFSMYVYPPSATSTYWDQSLIGWGPLVLPSLANPSSVRLTQPGTYRIGITAAGGSGEYALHLKLLAGLPGVDLGGASQRVGTRSDSIDATDVPHVVYQRTLAAGDRLHLDGTHEDSATVTFRLFKPGTTSIETTDTMAAETTGTLDFIVPVGQGGTYYVDTFCTAGAGNYSLAWSHTATTRMAFGTSAGVSATSITTAYGKAAALQVRLTDVLGPVPGVPVIIYRSYDSKTWSRIQTVTTQAQGTASVSFTPIRKTFLRASFVGSTYERATVAPTLTLNRYAYLTKPTSLTRVARNTAVSVSGYLRPRHTRGSAPVKLTCARQEGSKQVVYKIAYLKVGDYSSTTSKYAGTVLLPYAGRWILTTSVAGDTLHASTAISSSVLVNPTSLSLSASRSTCTYGIAARLTGVLKDMRGAILAGRTVVFERSSNAGNTWTTYRTLKTSTKGVVTTSVQPEEKTWYRFRYAGDRTQMGAASRAQVITPRDIMLTGTGFVGKKVYLEGGKGLFIAAFFNSLTIKDSAGRYVWTGNLLTFDEDPDVYYREITLPKNDTYTINPGGGILRWDTDWALNIQ